MFAQKILIYPWMVWGISIIFPAYQSSVSMSLFEFFIDQLFKHSSLPCQDGNWRILTNTTSFQTITLWLVPISDKDVIREDIVFNQVISSKTSWLANILTVMESQLIISIFSYLFICFPIIQRFNRWNEHLNRTICSAGFFMPFLEDYWPTTCVGNVQAFTLIFILNKSCW